MSDNESGGPPAGGPPALPPLPPDYAAEDRGPAMRAFFIVMTIVTVASIVMRFGSRALATSVKRLHERFGLDDWFALAGVPFILTMLGMSFQTLDLGFGRHVAVLIREAPENLLVISKNIYIQYFLYDTALLFIKASALFFLRRVFPGYASARWFSISLWVTHGLNVAWWIGIIFGTIFMCNPVEKNWNPSLEGTCGDTSGLFIGSAAPSVFIDLIILVLPLPILWAIQTSLARKIGITVIFVLGYGVIVVSLGRLITVLRSTDALNNDITYEGVPVVYWVMAEPIILLVSTCLPASLNLGRFVMSSYLSPLASRVYLAISSRGSSSRITGQHSEIHSVRSVESQNEILKVSPHQEYHMVDVRVGNSQGNDSAAEMPGQGIRVENDVRVAKD